MFLGAALDLIITRNMWARDRELAVEFNTLRRDKLSQKAVEKILGVCFEMFGCVWISCLGLGWISVKDWGRGISAALS